MKNNYESIFGKASLLFLITAFLTGAVGVLLVIATLSNRGGLIEAASVGIPMAITVFMCYVWSQVFRFLSELTIYLDSYDVNIRNVIQRTESIENRAEHTRQMVKELRDQQKADRVSRSFVQVMLSCVR